MCIRDRIQAGYQVRPLGGNSPVALANLAGAAHMTAHGQHGRGSDIDRVSPQRNGLHDIGRIMDLSLIHILGERRVKAGAPV